ncbi:MAG: FAD-dependent oxidoreductase [Rhizobacter sp.]|nr:FAD-dependent oxidoreductase [Rhizobacter sp.]
MSEGRAAPHVAVVGAGIVGSCIALALQKRGAAVTLVDRDEPGRGCSYGNSGAISTASVAPLAMPGVLSSVPAMLLDADGPLHLPWSYLPRALPWLARFVASARPETVARSAARLANVHAGAIERHEALTREVGVPELFLRRGHLHLYRDETSFEKDAAAWQLRERHGVRFERLDRHGVLALEPRIPERYRVGVFLADQATILNPYRYVKAIAAAFVQRGGEIERGTVERLVPTSGGWKLSGAPARIEQRSFAHVVVAAGAWSRRLLDPLGMALPLESQRGYHVQFDGARDVVSRTVVLTDRKVFATPMEEGLRVGGTVEIGGLDRPADMRRAELLRRIATETFAGLEGLAATQWMGHRPCMPDSIPVVGQAPGKPGLWLAIGHGHLGLTDSVNSAERIAEAML